MQKQALRRKMKAARAGAGAEQRATWSNAIGKALRQSEAWRQARTVGLYASFRGEVDTWDLLRSTQADGKALALPQVVNAQEPLSFRSVVGGPGDWPLVTGAFGVYEPDDSCAEVSLDRIDLLLVPALAVSRSGDRLGWGGGYYDQTLRLTSATVLALVFDCQVVTSVPTDAHDRSVDGWVSELGVFRV